MAKTPTEFSGRFMDEMIGAMRWLKSMGADVEQIRYATLGMIDESKRIIKIKHPVTHLKCDIKTGKIEREESLKEFEVNLRDTECADFFLKAKFKSQWLFTETPPKTWRREGSKAHLFPLESVDSLCKDVEILSGILSENVLTIFNNFDNIEISKLNITSAKPEELAALELK